MSEPESHPGLEPRTVQPVAYSLQGLRYHGSVPTRRRIINSIPRLERYDASVFRIN